MRRMTKVLTQPQLERPAGWQARNPKPFVLQRLRSFDSLKSLPLRRISSTQLVTGFLCSFHGSSGLQVWDDLEGLDVPTAEP